MRAGIKLVRLRLDDDDPLPPEHDRCTAPSLGLDDLYRRHKPGLLRFVAGFGRREDAEDIVQQVFARVVGRSPHGDIAAPGLYLRQAARNLVRDRAREASRNGEEHYVPADEVIFTDTDPISHLEARDQLARIEKAVLRLKPLTRQIFLACRVDGYSYGEIAEQTGLSVRGVEKQINRALKLLDRHLSRDA